MHACEIVVKADVGYDSRLYIWDVHQDTIQFFDFFSGKNDMDRSAALMFPIEKLV